MRRLLLTVSLLLVPACSAVDIEPAAEVPVGEQAVVVHVGDGDSLIAEVAGVEQRVRLIGINAPESDECFGSEATDRLEALVLDRQVTLVPDVETEDQYDRLLRYVYLEDTLINAEMVVGGFAMARSYEPNTAEQATLRAAEEEARRAELGLWSTCSVASDLQIVHVEADAPGQDDENLNGEWIKIENVGDEARLLDGWSIRDAESANRFEFPAGVLLEAGRSLTVFTGCGEATESGLFWCSPGPVWNNRGDVAFLLNPDGRIAARFGF